MESFADLDMPGALLRALSSQGVTVPFPIQAATLPNSLAGRDVLGRGRTGSGKTLAFGLALPARTAGQRAEARQPLGLILVPTRELAQQVTDALAPCARSASVAIGGVLRRRSADRCPPTVAAAQSATSRTARRAARRRVTVSAGPSLGAAWTSHGPVEADYLVSECAKIYVDQSRHWAVVWLWFLS